MKYFTIPYAFFILSACFIIPGGYMPSALAEQDILIIVHPDVAESELGKKAIKDIYLGNIKQWKDHSEIRIITFKEGPALKKLMKAYVQRSPAQFTMWWKRKMFLGEGIFPKLVQSNENMIDLVSQIKNSIGYIETPLSTEKVKIITIKEDS